MLSNSGIFCYQFMREISLFQTWGVDFFGDLDVGACILKKRGGNEKKVP